MQIQYIKRNINLSVRLGIMKMGIDLSIVGKDDVGF